MADEEPLDEEIFTDNPDVIAGDSGLIFNTKNGKQYLGKGDNIKRRDLIVVHHTADGDLATHGISKIGVGDKVIVVKGKDGDLYALSPGTPNPYRNCKPLRKSTHDYSKPHDPPDDSWEYRKYVCHLDKPIVKTSGGWPRINLRIDFDVQYLQKGFQCFYPYGAMWLGVSQDGKTYWWCGQGAGSGNPYMILGANPLFNLRNSNRYCIRNWLGSCPECCPPPFDEINYIQVHIRNGSSLFWKNFTKSRMLYLTVCEGIVTDDYCNSLNEF